MTRSLRDTIKRSVNQVKSSKDLIPHEIVDNTAKPVKDTPNHWGYHLILDLTKCNDNIDDEDQIEQFLRDLVKALEMKAIGDPIIFRVDSQKEGRGISALQLIETSNIAIHTDDGDEHSAYIDVFSCAPYQPETVINLIDQYFEPQKIEKLFLLRDAGYYPE
jgi:S-adenosylmethionine decarboxylase